jgi:hypothetical protein
VCGRSCRAAARHTAGGARLLGYELRAAFVGAAFRAVFFVDVFATFLALLTTVVLVDHPCASTTTHRRDA